MRARSFSCLGSAVLMLLLRRILAVADTPHLGTIQVEGLPEDSNELNPRGNLSARGGGGVGHGNSTSGVPALFSKEWEEQYTSGPVGCDLGRKRYVWRQCGFGSNIVHLMNAFVYGIAVKKWNDVAVVTPPGMLGALECTGSKGYKVKGYFCLFQPMPHVCKFGDEEEWKKFMRSKEVPEADILEAGEIDWAYIRLQQRSVQAEALEEHGVDTYGASAVMVRYFWNNLTPWLEEDIENALDRPEVDVFREKPYVGFHVRRGDKVAEGEAEKVETKEYLSAAAEYLEGQGANGAKEIRAIWVASTDPNVIKEVRALAREYFPNVHDEAIVWASGGQDGRKIATHSKFEEYSGFVMLFADLKMLSASRVFVGTFSSNVARLVALLREGVHGHQRDSCISLDRQEYGVQY
ncbi:unnamed protein product [Pylaiella littoralis]